MFIKDDTQEFEVIHLIYLLKFILHIICPIRHLTEI